MELTSNFFENQTLQNIACPGQDLSCKEFLNCTFKKCNFSDCKFSGASFIDCTFIDCNLSNIKVDNCGFQNITFENCKLLGIVFATINSMLTRWIYKKCAIVLCNFENMDIRNSRFLECVIRETDFINTNLAGSDFSDSDLYGSKFHNTNLEKANLVGAKNYYINPTCNKLKQARFSNPDVLSLLDTFEIKIEY